MPSTLDETDQNETPAVTVPSSQGAQSEGTEGNQGEKSSVKVDVSDPPVQDSASDEPGQEAAEPLPDPRPAPPPEVYSSVSTGSNLIVNEVSLANDWAVSPVVAVLGDSTHLDIISQKNLWSDLDVVQGESGSIELTGGDGSNAYNIAEFLTEPSSVVSLDEGADVSGQPSNWMVTELDGNLVFMDWIEQYAFLSDNDITVLSDSGSEIVVSTGDNVVVNGTTMLQLGNYFDLIVVDGNAYYANLISQTNVLFDDDVVKMVHPGNSNGNSASASGKTNKNGKGGKDNAPGQANKDDAPGKSGEAHKKIDTGDNLLWNQASIHKYGNVEHTQSGDLLQDIGNLPSSYDVAPDALLNNALFEGLNVLKVLHITGDLIDLQFIRQTNVLGDADQVAFVSDKLQGDPDSDWSVTTGENALINMASINDAGVDAKMHVGGQTYSDALLYQANLITDEQLQVTSDPLKLASEAVAFLADDLIVDNDNCDTDTHAAGAESTSVDVMQTMLA